MVVGAGFAGLAAVRALGKVAVEVVLVDQHNFHLFTPLAYQVASALLDPSEIAHPVRGIVRGQGNVRFRLGTAAGVDLDARELELEDGRLPYDYLVLAAGSVTDFFGNDTLREHAYPLKDLQDALDLRYRVLEQFETASVTPDPVLRRRLLTFAVVGGGPTGVEYAGALSELIRLVLRGDFPELDVDDVRIYLLEGADRILGAFERRLARAASRILRRKGIAVVPRALVAEVGDGIIRLSDGRELEAGTVVWTAGVRGSELARTLGRPLGRAGRVPVAPTLRLPGSREVFVIGDMAELSDRASGGAPLPMLAPVAIQEGTYAGRAIAGLLEGRDPEPFRYRDRGTMATIGRNAAVAQIGRLRFAGRLAWLAWLFVHLAQIIGFRNRLVVLVNWAWDYFFYDRPIRLMASSARGAAVDTGSRPMLRSAACPGRAGVTVVDTMNTKESEMAKYLLAYHGGDMPQSPEEQARIMAAWEKWYGALGPAVVDPGNPVGHARTIARDRSVSEGGGSNPVSGYTVIQADTLDAAVALARGCPVLDGNGSVEVCETFDVM